MGGMIAVGTGRKVTVTPLANSSSLAVRVGQLHTGSHGSHAAELELTTLLVVPLPALEVRVIVEDHEQTWRSLAVMVLRLGAPEEAALCICRPWVTVQMFELEGITDSDCRTSAPSLMVHRTLEVDLTPVTSASVCRERVGKSLGESESRWTSS